MYRSLPSASKLCENKNRERAYQLHLQKLKNIKPSINNAPPKEMPHLKRNMKKLQTEQENFEKIKYENQLLLNKMTDIMEKKYIDNENQNAKFIHSLNRESRKKELMRITRENQSILKRIQRKQPFYNRLDWERDRVQNEKYLQNICEYPLNGAQDSNPRASLERASLRASNVDNKMETYEEDQPWDEPESNDLPSNEDVDDLIDQVDKQLEEAGLKETEEPLEESQEESQAQSGNVKKFYKLAIVSASGDLNPSDKVYVSAHLANKSGKAYDDFFTLSTVPKEASKDVSFGDDFQFGYEPSKDALIFSVHKESTKEVIESAVQDLKNVTYNAKQQITLGNVVVTFVISPL